jgi:hypothetical protein
MEHSRASARGAYTPMGQIVLRQVVSGHDIVMMCQEHSLPPWLFANAAADLAGSTDQGVSEGGRVVEEYRLVGVTPVF